MKAQMRFQKIICLVMILVGALGLVYAFVYLTGSMAALGQSVKIDAGNRVSSFTASEGKYDALFYFEIQGFNDALMYCGIVMVLLGVLLYITACNKRRNYYISNYVATGLCAGGNIVISITLMAMNAHWKSEFLKVDFTAWKKYCDDFFTQYGTKMPYGDSTVWFDLGFAVYTLIIVASLLLILNLVWKILLMQGEKKLLAGNRIAGGETV